MANSEFHVKLTALLEDLIKTAMVDICSLVDVCSASLHMELNARKFENEDLNRKLQIMEHRLYRTTLLENVEDQNTTEPTGGGTMSCDVTETINELPEPMIQSKSNTESNAISQDSDSGINEAQTETQQVHFGQPKNENEEVEVTVRDEELEWYDRSFVSECDLQQSSIRNSEYSSVVLKEDADIFCHLEEHNTMSEVAFNDSVIHKNKRATYICDICGKMLSSEKSLNVHYTVHTADRSHECTQCGKQFVNITNLRIHQNIHSMHNKNQQSRKYSPKCKYICSICGKGLLTIQGLNCHLTTHSAERPFTCTWCGKKFAQQHNLKIHQNTHTGAKPFTYICQMPFADPKKHKRMHPE